MLRVRSCAIVRRRRAPLALGVADIAAGPCVETYDAVQCLRLVNDGSRSQRVTTFGAGEDLPARSNGGRRATPTSDAVPVKALGSTEPRADDAPENPGDVRPGPPSERARVRAKLTLE